ncbi:hypothetical protein PVK06_022617 [Gossypium arboreum]|uniref:RNase H type-1 domain-containing protein n=1 Tax=Gossypium arboreum TaxID=29729 RepID=A0ABR0P915_GOSAR|nr:hypothetical protein PVK06_022617 [Gossypium arboreum]
MWRNGKHLAMICSYLMWMLPGVGPRGKAYADIEAFILHRNHGFHWITIKSDCDALICRLNNCLLDLSLYGQIFEEAYGPCVGFVSVYFCYVFKLTNGIAYSLAHWSLDDDCSLSFGLGYLHIIYCLTLDDITTS